jgi:hypothetical protein
VLVADSPVQAWVAGTFGEEPDDLTGVHGLALVDSRGDGFQARAKAVGVLNGHDATVHHRARESDGALGGRAHRCSRTGGQIDAAVACTPRVRWRVEEASHGAVDRRQTARFAVRADDVCFR